MKLRSLICVLCIAILLSACGNDSAEPETLEVTVPITSETQPAEGREPIETAKPTEPVETAAPTEPTEPTEPERVVFGEDITFSGEYFFREDTIPYALFTPSTAEDGEKLPLILFLHGQGEYNTLESWYMDVGMPKVMREWTLEGFNAYVLCPQLHCVWQCGDWSNRTAAGRVKELIETLAAEYPIDTDHIMLVGFSSGGMGALYFVAEYLDCFSKLVVMSSPDVGADTLEKITIPTIGYSETGISTYSFMNYEFPLAFGENSVRYYDVVHDQVPCAAFNDDSDGNNRSDLVEWLLGDIQ